MADATLTPSDGPKRFMLFRWWRRTQMDIRLAEGRGFLSLGLDRRRGWRPFAYWSPDASGGARSEGGGLMKWMRWLRSRFCWEHKLFWSYACPACQSRRYR